MQKIVLRKSRPSTVLIGTRPGLGGFTIGLVEASNANDERQSASSSTVLPLVDVINHFRFPDGDRILRHALKVAPNIAMLKSHARAAGIPTIMSMTTLAIGVPNDPRYWSTVCAQVQRERDLLRQVRPDEQDYLVLKPMYSALYQTRLETLLRHLESRTLILAGLRTNSCIICTAHDANMQDLKLVVPSDCSAARASGEHKQALDHLKNMLDANINRSNALKLELVSEDSFGKQALMKS